MKPLVSILITVFNREAFVSDSITSVLKSTFEDYEIIVVDDCSTDHSLSIVEGYCSTYNKVFVHSNARNLGQFENRQKAASLARGKYIKYLDSDDILYPHSLSIMVEALEAHTDAAVALSHSAAEAESPYPLYLTSRAAFTWEFLRRGCLSCGPSGGIIRRDAFEAIGGYDPSWGVIADIELWYRLAARWPVVLLQPGLVWWRRHGGQEFTKDNADLAYLQRGYDLAKHALNDQTCPLPQVERETALQRARQHFSRRLLSLVFRQHRVRTAFRLFRASDLQLMDLVKGFGAYW